MGRSPPSADAVLPYCPTPVFAHARCVDKGHCPRFRGIEDQTIQQIAALPYIIDPDGHAQVMLITSRDTGRWVIPKGNPITGLASHEAAAQEA